MNLQKIIAPPCQDISPQRLQPARRAITHDPATDSVTLTWDWNHLIPVMGFLIYRFSEPDFPTDTYHIWESVPGTDHQFTDPANGQKYLAHFQTEWVRFSSGARRGGKFRFATAAC
ncbi:MAG: hypothetical protein K0B87_05300 [Candidatus Syntrophosphaera sp.]|nr:hypothetical protein [Candidatus Syntrophosphaera sp.]